MSGEHAARAAKPGSLARPGKIVDVHLGEDDLDKALRVDVTAGLTAEPKELPPRLSDSLCK